MRLWRINPLRVLWEHVVHRYAPPERCECGFPYRGTWGSHHPRCRFGLDPIQITFKPVDSTGGPVFEGYTYDGNTFFHGKPPRGRESE